LPVKYFPEFWGLMPPPLALVSHAYIYYIPLHCVVLYIVLYPIVNIVLYIVPCSAGLTMVQVVHWGL